MSTQQFPMAEALGKPVDAVAPRFALYSAVCRIEQAARAYLAEYLRQRAIRRAEAQLRGLDDRMLRDIGLTRGEIHSAVRDATQGFQLAAQPR